MYVIWQMVPYICGNNLDFVLIKLEENSIGWFENNYMKMNSNKCHLFLSRKKIEHLWAKRGNNRILKNRNVKLSCITTDNELKFDEHPSNICLKANKKISALTIIRKYLRK